MALEPLLLKHRNTPGSAALEFYLAQGGYEAAKKAIRDFAPDKLIEEVKASGLRGRGGAGFPCGMKWSFVPKSNDKPKYLAVNADESEPGTFKDRILIEQLPHLLLEGILICCWAVQIKTAYIYIRGEFTEGAKILQKAIDEAYAKGYFGKNALGSGLDVDVTLHRGAGAYICGEETGLLTSLEGNRGYPKLKPPFPATHGLFRCPTVVNNVETLSNLPFIVNRGAAWFKTIGTEKSPGGKLFCVCGHVKKPDTYEVPLGTPFKELLALAGGVLDDRPLKAVVPGGSSAPVLTADEAMKVNMDFDSLAAAKTMLGSGGVIVMHDGTCMVDALYNLLRFYHHESCGQCTPCREGTGWIEKILHRLEHGQGRTEDFSLLMDICDNMQGKTICVLADAAVLPTRSFVTKFRAEFEYHVKQRKCLVARDA
ncbi:MAG: NADH-quinone oxidoreductase subunit NuoF [Planctomycetes bacterium]|nr:NADH-quinone oxidoreductase subunit NuoF [Planctomycetota bacterium]